MSNNQSNNQPQFSPALNEQEVLAQLAKPFEDHEIEWKIQNVIENRYNKAKSQYQGLGLGYIDARAIQRRLNEVCGLGWSTTYNHYMLGQYGVVECTIGILVNGQWIYRTDGVEIEQGTGAIEPVKSAFSNALKRAAVHFGIGHFLYSIGSVYIDIYQNNVQHERNSCPKDADKSIGGNFKVNGQKVQIYGKYVSPKYSDILRKQQNKKNNGNSKSNQQNQHQPQNPQQHQQPSNNPQQRGSSQGKPQYQQNPHQNGNVPTEQEYRQMVKSFYDCLHSLKIAPANVTSLYQFVQSPIYDSVENTPFPVLQALYGKLNPIKILLELGQSTFHLNEQQIFSYASRLLKEPIGKVSNLINRIDQQGVNMIFDMIRQDLHANERRQA